MPGFLHSPVRALSSPAPAAYLSCGDHAPATGPGRPPALALLGLAGLAVATAWGLALWPGTALTAVSATTHPLPATAPGLSRFPVSVTERTAQWQAALRRSQGDIAQPQPRSAVQKGQRELLSPGWLPWLGLSGLALALSLLLRHTRGRRGGPAAATTAGAAMLSFTADPGTEAPDFEIPAREGLRLALSDYRGEYVVVLFYPVEHFVKFRAFSERYSEFLQLNALVLGVTSGTDLHLNSNLAFPLVNDFAGAIARRYGMLDGEGRIAQGYFIIDTEGTVQHMSKSNLLNTRAVDESIHVLRGLQIAQSKALDKEALLPNLASYPAAEKRKGSQGIRVKPTRSLAPIRELLAPLKDETIGVLLLNLGGPDTLEDVEPFLYNLFSDPEIIQLPGKMSWMNKVLAFFVAKVRARTSMEGYKAIGGGSPQLATTIQQGQAIEAAIAQQGLKARCYVAMRYWEPFTSTAIAQIKADGIRRLVVLPLYPQFSISTSGSSLRLLEKSFYEDRDFSKVVTAVIPAWYNREGYIKAMADMIAATCDKFEEPTKPVIFFSAHGVPKKYIDDLGDPYLEQMEACVRFIIDDLRRRGYTNGHVTAFQSQVGPVEWLKPYTSDKLKEMGKQGVKQLVVVPISFVQEHIETLEEIDMEYRELAEECGITQWERVPTLGLNQRFIDDLGAAVIEAMPQLIQPAGKAINEADPVSLRIVNDLVELYKKEQLKLVPQAELNFGLTPTAEVVNGRAAMATLAIATLWATLQGKALQLLEDPRFFH